MILRLDVSLIWSIISSSYPASGGHCASIHSPFTKCNSFECRWRSLVDQEESGVFSVAKEKLIHGVASYDFENKALALLGQRFALDVAFGHHASVTFLDTAIASHMRICESVTEDGMRRFTSYPSEPILSCASTTHLLNMGWSAMMIFDNNSQSESGGCAFDFARPATIGLDTGLPSVAILTDMSV